MHSICLLVSLSIRFRLRRGEPANPCLELGNQFHGWSAYNLSGICKIWKFIQFHANMGTPSTPHSSSHYTSGFCHQTSLILVIYQIKGTSKRLGANFIRRGWRNFFWLRFIYVNLSMDHLMKPLTYSTTYL